MLKVGVIADTDERLAGLVDLARSTGYVVSERVCTSRVCEVEEAAAKADVWLSLMDLDDDFVDQIIDVYDRLSIPLIFEGDDEYIGIKSDDSPPVSDRERLRQRVKRLRQKLDVLAVQVEDATTEWGRQATAKQVWVLGASTGGPSAVASFLDGIPAELAGVAFLYVQHIELNAIKTLKQVVEQHSDWHVVCVDKPELLHEKTIYIVSPNVQIDLDEDGTLRPSKVAWAGDYTPSINHVIAQVARRYRECAGAIVFTGMGDDGAKSCLLLHHMKGQVWVQSRESCTIDSMPACVENIVPVNRSADPAGLANDFVAYNKISIEAGKI